MKALCGFILGCLVILVSPLLHADLQNEKTKEVLPSANQLRYQESQLGCFVHYGPAAYLNTGGGDYLTVPAPDLFNPAKLDVEQWMLAAKAIGAKHIVLTAKHHNGYCLWPTKNTDFSIVQSAWKEGKGDVVREFVDAARKHGLAPGLYVSAGDSYFGCKSTGDPRGQRKLIGDPETYFPIFMQQLTELLTNYGELEVIWFDGAYNPFDPDVLDASGKPVGGKYVDVIDAAVRRLQPKAVIMGGGHSDLRWSGSEQGKAPYPLWNVVAPGGGPASWLPEYATGWFIPESNIHTRKHWFWSPDTDKTLKSPEQMMEAYDSSVGVGANLLVNLTPDMDGLIPAAEVEMLTSFGSALEKRFSDVKGSVSSKKGLKTEESLVLTFDQPTSIRDIVIEEDLRQGQHIQAYKIESLNGGSWKTIAEGTSIGRKRIHSFDSIETKALRLVVGESGSTFHIRAFSAF